MIAVDCSALVAILLREPEGPACAAALAAADRLIISAATMAEALIVAQNRGFAEEMRKLFHELPFEAIEVTADTARRVAGIYARWGKGAHPAGLNFGDCFAYDVAKEHGCPLLYVGDDFQKTGSVAAI
jgi:ribonuclease VapC